MGASSADPNGVNNAGRVIVREWSAQAGEWVSRATVNGDGASDGIGKAIALSADGAVLAIGEALHDTPHTSAGRVRVFDWNNAQYVRRVDPSQELHGDAQSDSAGLLGCPERRRRDRCGGNQRVQQRPRPRARLRVGTPLLARGRSAARTGSSTALAGSDEERLLGGAERRRRRACNRRARAQPIGRNDGRPCARVRVEEQRVVGPARARHPGRRQLRPARCCGRPERRRRRCSRWATCCTANTTRITTSGDA